MNQPRCQKTEAPLLRGAHQIAPGAVRQGLEHVRERSPVALGTRAGEVFRRAHLVDAPDRSA